MSQRLGLLHTDCRQPRTTGQAEVSAARRGRFERRDPSGNLVRMLCVRVEARHAKPDSGRRARHLKQRGQWRLVEQIGKYADDVEAVRLSCGSKLRITTDWLISLKCDADLGHGQ